MQYSNMPSQDSSLSSEPGRQIRRLGILADGFTEWGGGIDFLRLVSSSLVAAAPDIELHLLLPTRGPRLTTMRALRAIKRGVYNTLLGRNIVVTKRPSPEHVMELVRNSGIHIQERVIDAGSGEVARAARRLRLDAVLPAINPLNVGRELPWLGYIYDYQHVHLPHLFAPHEIKRRNENFAQMLDQARCVIVNARAVETDIKTYHPNRQASVLTLPFAAAPHMNWLAPTTAPLEKYEIEGPYFIVCNQFWQHKDHLTIWRAFAELHKEHPKLQLVCTGETHDYRNPGHMEALAAEARRLNITERLHILGLIPKADQIALMRSAVAVVQATWNEGGPGGGAVFDAVSLGVPSIVSNIPVNLELDEPTVRFFSKGDHFALAEAMRDELQRPSRPQPSPEQLIADGLKRRRACGMTLLSAIRALQA